MTVTLPYRADASAWPIITPEMSVHAATDILYDNLVEPFHHAFWNEGARLGDLVVSRLLAEGKISWGQRAVVLEATLRYEILNGGLVQFLDNYPGLVGETRRFLIAFAPPAMAKAYAANTEGLAYAIATLSVDPDNPDFAALRQCFDDWAVHPILVDADVADDIDAFDERYVGQSGQDAPFGTPLAGEGWSETLARSVVRYCVDHPEDFVQR